MHLFRNLSGEPPPGGRIISEIFSDILFLNSMPAFSAAPNNTTAEDASIRLLLLMLNLTGTFFQYRIAHRVLDMSQDI